MYYPRRPRNIILCIIVFCAFLLSIIAVDCFSGGNNDVNQKKFNVARIGVLDGERLKAEALCFKSHEKIADMVSALLSKIREASTTMKETYESVKKDKSLPTEKRNAKLAKIEMAWAADSARYNTEMQDIRNLDMKLTEFIQNKLMDIIASFAKSAKVDIIVNKGSRDMLNVFYNSRSIDITDIIIKKLNKIIPTVDLKELSK